MVFLFIACNKPTEKDAQKEADIRTTNVSGIYPHSPEFKKTYQHGQSYMADKTSCLQCHGLDLKGGNSKVSCTSCHNYPHEASWAVPQQHGTYYLGLETAKKESCMKCHSPTVESAQSTRKSITCSGCHSLYPHGVDYINTHAENKPDSGSSCTVCHNDIRNNELGCTTCHSDAQLRPMWKPMEAKPPSAKLEKSPMNKSLKNQQKTTFHSRIPSSQKKKK